MNALEIIRAKKAHLARLANQKGAAGEVEIALKVDAWMPRPKGRGLKVLLQELAAIGIIIKGSSFDAITTPEVVNFEDADSVRNALPNLTFIEIKTSNQPRVKGGFEGFFFALTESEITAADQLGTRHVVALYNRLTEEILLTSVPEILSRSKSMTWQLSVQL